MSRLSDEFGLGGQGSAAADVTPKRSSLSQEFGLEAPKVKGSGLLRRTVGDAGVTALKSAISVPEAAVGIADLVSGGRAGKSLESAGFRPKEAKGILDGLYSTQQQEANARVAESEGFVDTAQAMIENPSTIAHMAGESVAPMLAGGVVARGAGMISKLPAWARGAVGEGAVGAGLAAEGVRQQTEDGLLTAEQAALTAASGAGTGLIGAGGAKLAQRLGIGEIDTLLAGGADATAETGKGVLRRAGEGALVEGVIQEAPQSAQEQAFQNLALDRPVGEGVGSAVAGGVLAGGLVGGIAGPIGSQPKVLPMPTEDNPAPAPVEAPDPAAGALSKAASLLPTIETPAPVLDTALLDAETIQQQAATPEPALLALPAPNSMYVDREGNARPVVPVRDDTIRQPRSGQDGLSDVIQSGERPNTVPAEEQRRIDRLAVADLEQERADRVAAAYVSRANVAANEALAREDAPSTYALPKGLELSDPKGHGRWFSDFYRNSVEGLVSQLTPGGDVAYVRNANDVITGRTPSINPKWWQNMDAGAKPSSIAQAQAIVTKALEGKPLGPKQARFITAMMDMADEMNADPQRAADNEAILQEIEFAARGEALRNQADYESGAPRQGVSEQDDAELFAYLQGKVEPFRMADLQPEELEQVRQELLALDDTSEATAQAGDNTDTDNEFQGVTYGTNQATGPAGGQVPAQQGLPGNRDGDSEAFDLTTQSEQELRTRADEVARAQQTQDAAAREQEQRSQADTERNDFSLTGSDRVSDVGAAAGQNDLLAAPPATPSGQAESIQGADIDGDWSLFSAESGTLGLPRADMPQIKAEHRGAMVNFLKARGVRHAESVVPADSLKPTQAEFSRKKVEAAKSYEGGDRAILVSRDGHVLDGHHQWMAKRDAGEDVRIIRLSRNINNLLDAVREFPSAGMDQPATESIPEKAARLQAERAAERQAQAPATSPEAAPAPQERIEDFGEKLEGARKDYASKLKDAETLDIAESTLTQAWPEPDYQKLLDSGADPWTVGLIRAVREEIAPKPRVAWKLRGWVSKVETLRDMAKEVMADPAYAAKMKSEASKNPVLREFVDKVDLYEAVGHSKSLKGIAVNSGSYTIFNGVTLDRPQVKWSVERKVKSGAFGNMPRQLATADTKAEVIAKFKAMHQRLDAETSKADKAVRFGIYSTRGTTDYFIGKKIGKDVVRIKDGFDSAKEARVYLQENQSGLESTLTKMKDLPKHRKETNAPRVGADHRANGDVSPEEFAEAFGFRGVQFGNYVEQGRRQQDMNRAYDALLDLAGILNVPARAISLNGELGLSFGARGKGGKNPAAAHYEAGNIVINLTKGNGAGSLAHEWWHALDNYFTRERGERNGRGFASEGDKSPGVRPEVVEAFRQVTRTVNQSGMLARSRSLDTTRSKAYWSTTREMTARAFESYTIEKMRDQGASNDYLANIVSPEYWSAAESLGIEQGGRYPYPEAAEIPAVRAAYDNFFSVVESKEGDDGNVVLFQRRDVGASGFISRADVEQLAVRKMGKSTAANRFRFVDYAELPAQIKKAATDQGASPDEVRAVHWRGMTYMVDGRFATEAEAAGAMFHEHYVHFGLRAKYGKGLRMKLGGLLSGVGGLKGVRELSAKQNIDLTDYARGMASDTNISSEDRGLVLMEELMAHMAETTGTLRRTVEEFVGMVRAWLRNNGYADLSRLGVTDLAFVLRGARQAATDAAGTPSGAPMFSRTKPQAQTDSAAFKKWFGKSKVVGKDGKPLVVYHGSGGDVTRFSIERNNGYRGAYFSKNRATAEMYAGYAAGEQGKQRSEGGAVYPVYLSMQNPLVIDGRTIKQDSTLYRVAKRLFPETAAQVEFENKMNKQRTSSFIHEEALAELERRGYDGIINDVDSEIVIFKSGQAKSAIGNNGNFDPDTADIRFRRTPIPGLADAPDLTAGQRDFLNKVGTPPTTTRVRDWIQQRTERAATKIRQGLVDRYAALKELDEKLLGKDFIDGDIHNSAWVLARMSSAASGSMNAMLTNGRLRFNAREKVVTMRDDDTTGGLNAVLGQLGSAAEVERFMGWIAANRADKLMQEGRENLFTADEIAAGKQLNTGRTEDGTARAQIYAKTFREFQQYRDDVLSIAEQTGIISAESRQMWRDEFYVPFYRVMDEQATGPANGKGLSRQEAYKKLKGGRENLNDLLENTLMNFHHLLSASLKNQAAVQTINNAEQAGIASPVTESNRDPKTSTFVLKGGQRQFYEVSDPLIFEALTALADPGLNNLAVQTMATFKRVFTNMTTVTPQFIIANTFRDLMQAAATSPTSKNLFKNVSEGLSGYNDPKTRAQMQASGGAFSFGHLYGADVNEVKASLNRTVKGAELITSPAMVPKILQMGWRKWGDIADTAENISRTATYRQNVEQRGMLRAAYEARDIMDFSQHGGWPAVRFLIRVVPFLNARLQGLDKLYRSGLKPSLLTAMGKGTASDKEAAARFSIVTGALTVATIALYLANADDEEYRKLEDWQKDSYWFFRIGGNAFFLPKPFEVGAIATMAERLTEQMVDDTASGDLFADRIKDMMTQTFSFSPVPQMFQPVLDIYSNKDAFTGRDIESMGMDRLSIGLRSRENTTAAAQAVSAASRVLGDESAIALSPVQADHLIRGYLGTVGANAAGIIDTVWRGATGKESPDKRWSEYQPIRRFYRDLEAPAPYTRYSTLFYEGLREAGRVYADVRELQSLGRQDEANTLIAENRNILAMRKNLNQQQRRLSEIGKRIEAVRRSDSDGEWKRKELDRLNLMRGQITEQVGKRLEQL